MSGPGNFRLQIRCIFLLSGMLLLTGCVGIRRGYYEASPASGWRRQKVPLDERHRFVFRPASKVMRSEVTFSTIRKGELTYALGTFSGRNPWAEQDAMIFPTNRIRIVYEDTGKEDAVPRKDKYGQHFQVGDSENFTIILPPFTVNGKPVPELSVHFKWSNHRYLVLLDPGL
jgi:hypothetical protein